MFMGESATSRKPPEYVRFRSFRLQRGAHDGEVGAPLCVLPIPRTRMRRLRMSTVVHEFSPRSLADIRPNERVSIKHVLFGTLKVLCGDLGLHEGAEVRCRRATRSVLVLENERGRTVILDQDWARFVEVRSVS